METVIFLLFAAAGRRLGARGGGAQSPIYATMSLVVTLFSMAVLFVLLGAPFLGALQILVYAGAIVVLFLFVIMLLNVQEEERAHVDRGVQRWVALLGAVVFLGMFWLAFWRTGLRIGRPAPAPLTEDLVSLKGLATRAVHRLPAAVRDRRPAAAGGGDRRHGRRRRAPAAGCEEDAPIPRRRRRGRLPKGGAARERSHLLVPPAVGGAVRASAPSAR